MIAAFVLFCTVQVLYWPMLMKPGTELYWWQSKIAADIGLIVGFPVWIAVLKSPFSGLANELFMWLCTAVWTTAAYFIAGAGVRVITKLYAEMRNLTRRP